MPNAMDLARLDPPGDDHLPAHPVLRLVERRDRFARRHRPMIPPIMTDPDFLIVRNPEMDADKRTTSTAPFEFPQPLVGNEEIADDRHRVASAWWRFQPRRLPANAGSSNRVRVFFRREVNEHGHGGIVSKLDVPRRAGFSPPFDFLIAPGPVGLTTAKRGKHHRMKLLKCGMVDRSPTYHDHDHGAMVFTPIQGCLRAHPARRIRT